MARIRHIEIRNFRAIKSLSWYPSEGMNCLIGAGDSGKSSVLEAIHLCLGGRRNIAFSDADFYQLDVGEDIDITVAVGDLEDRLMNFEAYGDCLRGFNRQTREFHDEPGRDLDTILTVQLTVGSDLEPVRSLYSERVRDQGKPRYFAWTDRFRLAPTRIDATSAYHLGWRQGSVLNRVSSERADASSELAKYARLARAELDEFAPDQLDETLRIVAAKARELGIPIGDRVKAMMDAGSVSLSGGT
ncbi:MAG: AAA family ATPase, partial [Chloroflexi bacterium]|nr:AAA family ATPase [Chloroflexota bacterium]